MSRRTLGDGEAASCALDVGRLGRLSWLGLAVAAIGWALLLVVAIRAPRAMDVALSHADTVEIARCLIVSGFSFAVIGALQTGFGALNRFFAAVLTRSAPRAAAAPVPAPADPIDRAAEPVRERRPYQILADGSVEVETIVGTRRFDTMDEAREFI